MAIKEDGTLWNCGENATGALGDGTTENRLELEQVAEETEWRSADGGARHTAALSENNISLWGNNIGGQIGDGTTDERLTPFLFNECTLSAFDSGLPEFIIYPNPTSDVLNIATEQEMDYRKIALYSLAGEVLLTSKGTAKIDLSSLDTGIYLLVIELQNGSVSHRRVVKN